MVGFCGPGNNGGDGLVAARHLYHFGYKPSICYPKQTNKPIYHGLVTQSKSLGISFVSAEELSSNLKDEFDLVIDAMFGFSFHGATNSKLVDVAALRLNYAGFELLEEQMKKDPLEQFKVWFDDAISRKISEPNAMTLGNG